MQTTEVSNYKNIPIWPGSFPSVCLLPLTLRHAELGDAAEWLVATSPWLALLGCPLLAPGPTPRHPPPPSPPTLAPDTRQRNNGNNGKGWTLEPKRLWFKSCFYLSQHVQSGAMCFSSVHLGLEESFSAPRLVKFLTQSKCSTTLLRSTSSPFF